MFVDGLGETNYSTSGDDISKALKNTGYFARILPSSVFILVQDSSEIKRAIYQKQGQEIVFIEGSEDIEQDNAIYHLSFSELKPELS